MTPAGHARWVDWMQMAGVILSALAAAVLSYVAQFFAAKDILGLDWRLAVLFPFSTDGPMLTASASLWMKAISGTSMRNAKWDWCILGAFAVLSTVFNIAHAPTGGPGNPTFTVPFIGWGVSVAQLMAAVPSLALLVSFERLIARLARKSVHPRTSAPPAPPAPDPGGMSLQMEPVYDTSSTHAGQGTTEGRSLRHLARRPSEHDRVPGQGVPHDAAHDGRAGGGHQPDAGMAGAVGGAAGLPGRGAGPEGAAPEGDAAPVDAAGLNPLADVPADVPVNAAVNMSVNGSVNGSVSRALSIDDALRRLRSELPQEQWLTLKRGDAARELRDRYGLSVKVTSVGTALSAVRSEERRTATNGAGRG